MKPVLPGILLALMTCSAVPLTTNAGQRPISDFVSRQGTYCLALDVNGFPDCAASSYGGSGCFQYLPGIPNFVGLSDPKSGYGASVDYAGIMEVKLQSLTGGTKSLGTTITGSVNERLQPDGSVEVTVVLHTQNALTWAIQGFDNYATDPLLFGHRVEEIAAGADAALGDVTVKVIFTNPAPGAPLPDLIELINCRIQDLKLISVQVRATGTFRAAFGVADGTKGFMESTQMGLIGTAFRNGFNGRLYDAFPAEHIILRTTGK